MSFTMPYLRFFPRDWLGDPLLRMISPAARGLWMDLLCVMSSCEPYGHLTVAGKHMTDERAASAVSLPLETYRELLAELEAVGVTSRTAAGVIFSRRLVRDHAAFTRSSRAGKAGGGNPALRRNEQQAPQTPSALPNANTEAISQKPYARSPNPPLKHPIKGAAGATSAPEFELFWSAYPRKTAKKAAIKAWIAAKDKPDIAAILSAIARAKTSEQWQKDGGQYIPMPSTWLNQGRWDDGERIEVTGTSSTPKSRIDAASAEIDSDLAFNLSTWRENGTWSANFDRAASKAAAIGKHGLAAGPIFDTVAKRLEKANHA